MNNQFLWFAFCFVFFGLAIFHFKQATKSIKPIENKAQIKRINGINLGINEFVNDFNTYVADINKDNKRINIVAGIGYVAALFTSAYSFLISLPNGQI